MDMDIINTACAELAQLLAQDMLNQLTSKKKRNWCRNWLMRKNRGLTSLVQELRLEDSRAFKQFMRMNTESFDAILNLIGPGL